MEKSVLVIGGTGFIGSALACHLSDLGHRVTIWKRSQSPIDSTNPEFIRALSHSDVVINLAGSPLIKRWSGRIRKQAWLSRVGVTHTLVESIKKCPKNKRPTQLINGSAIGYFNRVLHPVTNIHDAPGDGFLADICVAWEAAANKAVALGLNVSIIRIGVVLGKNGGILKQLLPIFKMGMGGHVGSGLQGFAWIHLTDLCRLVSQEMQSTTSRVIHAHVPVTCDYRQFCQTLATALKRRSWLHVPEYAVRIALGEAADILVGSPYFRLNPAPGFKFEHPELGESLDGLMR